MPGHQAASVSAAIKLLLIPVPQSSYSSFFLAMMSTHLRAKVDFIQRVKERNSSEENKDWHTMRAILLVAMCVCV
jgi:hypothetical protein